MFKFKTIPEWLGQSVKQELSNLMAWGSYVTARASYLTAALH